jgi:hypothetical protein
VAEDSSTTASIPDRQTSRMALGPTQPPIQGVTGTLSPGVKRGWRESKHSVPSNTEMKMVEIHLQSPMCLP